jgi:hypothetical protein
MPICPADAIRRRSAAFAISAIVPPAGLVIAASTAGADAVSAPRLKYVALAVPTTSNFLVGFVSPIPTLPVVDIRIASFALV